MRFHSLLSVDQCAESLVAATDKDAYYFPAWHGSRPVTGIVHKHDFRIRKRRSLFDPFYSFAPLFYGTWREDATGTLIEGYFRLHPITMGAVVLWLVITVGLTVPFSYSIGVPVLWLFFLVPSIGFVLFGQLLGLSERKYLREFLERTLKARRVDTSNVEL